VNEEEDDIEMGDPRAQGGYPKRKSHTAGIWMQVIPVGFEWWDAPFLFVNLTLSSL
jgi:hypothetical protein